MLANNNKAIINKLAQNTVKTNKRQFMILFFTVALSAFMIFGVFTIGITYLDLSRLQNTRLFGHPQSSRFVLPSVQYPDHV